MKKLIFLIILMTSLLVTACGSEKGKDGNTQSLKKFYKDANVSSVNEIIIQDGTTGATQIIDHQEQIDEFLALIQDIMFKPQENQEDLKGWEYRIRLFDDKNEFDFTLNRIEDINYESSPGIYPIVDKYYKSLESKNSNPQ